MDKPSPAWIDTHVHLDRLPASRLPEKEVRAARGAGVGAFVIPGVDPRHWENLLSLCALPGVFAAPGVHPGWAHLWDEKQGACLREILLFPSVKGVGEVGLDAAVPVAAEVQERALRWQVRLALEAQKPLLIHCRGRTGRLLAILREEGAGAVGGIFHSFSGSIETAREAISLRFALGFGGGITAPGARRAPEVLRGLPAGWIVLETDAPDQAPHPHGRGEGLPVHLPAVGEAVAKLRGWSLEETARITTANACRILGLEDPRSDIGEAG